MDALRSALEEFRAIEIRRLSDAELEAQLLELRRAAGQIEAECARRVAEIERRRVFARTGHLSVTAWVEHRFQATWSDAARRVRVARALQHMPLAREALAEGDVSPAALGKLVDALEASPSEFGPAEDMLVQAARTMPVRDLRGRVERWKADVAAEAAARDEAERFERRGFMAVPGSDGMVGVNGKLDPENGQAVVSAVRAMVDSWTRSGVQDARTRTQMRADAIGEICRQWLDRIDRPVVGGERPHVTVTVDLEILEGRAGRRCELDDAGAVTAEAARRVACDASVTRVITRGVSEPLEIGRQTRVVSPALRRAVVVRDRHCRFPECDRPPAWCDAHHIRHWADGGATDMSNLILLCRRHHRAVHHEFRLEVVAGEPLFLTPEGWVLPDQPLMMDRAPP